MKVTASISGAKAATAPLIWTSTPTCWFTVGLVRYG